MLERLSTVSIEEARRRLKTPKRTQIIRSMSNFSQKKDSELLHPSIAWNKPSSSAELRGFFFLSRLNVPAWAEAEYFPQLTFIFMEQSWKLVAAAPRNTAQRKYQRERSRMNKHQAADRSKDGKTCKPARVSSTQALILGRCNAMQCRYTTKSRAPWQLSPRVPPRSRPDEDLEIQPADD